MTNNYKFSFIVSMMFLLSVQSLLAQTVEFRGVRHAMRYDDGDDAKTEYLGWNSETGKAEFSGDYGLWSLNLANNKITTDLVQYENLMYGNSGALYINGVIYTVFSHEKEDGEAGEMEFIVRTWDANTYEKLSQHTFPKSANLESRGMAYNPKDGKVYGLFYLTDVALPVDDDYTPDQDDIDMGQTTDAGYAICTIDLQTMEITQITPGLYYDNYVTLACSPEGRLFSMTSGGTLVEWDCNTGLMITKTVVNDYGEDVQVSVYDHSGVQSQFKRQAACFDHNTGKMYWNGYINNGMGYNDWGSYGPLSDKEWRTNGKYDTALYEVDIETGKATKISNIPNRMTFSCLWVVGADGTTPDPTGINNAEVDFDGSVQVFNAAGQMVGKDTMTKGLYIVKQGNATKKILVK